MTLEMHNDPNQRGWVCDKMELWEHSVDPEDPISIFQQFDFVQVIEVLQKYIVNYGPDIELKLMPLRCRCGSCESEWWIVRRRPETDDEWAKRLNKAKPRLGT